MRVIQIMEWTNAGFYGRSFFGSCYRYFNDLPDALATWYFTHTPNIVWVFASNVAACYLHTMYNTLCIHFMHSTFRICHLFIRNQFILTEKQFMIKWSRTSSSKEILNGTLELKIIGMSNFFFHRVSELYDYLFYKIVFVEVLYKLYEFCSHEEFCGGSLQTTFEESRGASVQRVEKLFRCVKTAM